ATAQRASQAHRPGNGPTIRPRPIVGLISPQRMAQPLPIDPPTPVRGSDRGPLAPEAWKARRPDPGRRRTSRGRPTATAQVQTLAWLTASACLPAMPAMWLRPFRVAGVLTRGPKSRIVSTAMSPTSLPQQTAARTSSTRDTVLTTFAVIGTVLAVLGVLLAG